MPITSRVDVLVIGGGMAGVTVAAALAPNGTVLLVEAEPQLAWHSTGRSAAAFLESYGPPAIRQLTRASRALFDAAADDPLTPPLLTPRPLLWLARADQLDLFERGLAEQPTLECLDADGTLALLPVLRPGHVAAGAVERNAADIDVAAAHQHHLRRFRAAGGEVRTGAGVLRGERRAGTWRIEVAGPPVETAGVGADPGRTGTVETGTVETGTVETGTVETGTVETGTVEADVVVNAAGAWADIVAARCGARPVGLVAKRRTAAIARSATAVGPAWPLAVDVADRFYLKPEGPHLLVSPADETAVPPGDAKPEEADVAAALERVNEATVLGLRSVVRAWAGLRTFAPDGDPVLGADPLLPGFFWLAGQGGYGIQAAPALAALAAALVSGASLPPGLGTLDVDALGPARLALGARGRRVH